MTQRLKLSSGYSTLLDDEDYIWIAKWSWRTRSAGSDKSRNKSMYACRIIHTEKADGKWKRTTISMHREILKATAGVQVDHINGDGLDNRKCNLRLCSQTQNMANRLKSNIKAKSKFKGVSWHQPSGRNCGAWTAQLGGTKNRKYLGRFTSEGEAALAYDIAAKEIYGVFASLNFPQLSGINEEGGE